MRTIGEHNLYELDLILQAGSPEICDVAFSHTVLEVSKLANALFVRCSFDNVTFQGEQDAPIYFVESTFSKVLFDNVKLTGSQFLRSSIADSSARQAVLRHCLFINTNVSGVDLRCVVMERSTVTRCRFDTALFDYSQWKETMLDAVEFEEESCSFLQSRFEEAVFIEPLALVALERDSAELRDCRFIEKAKESAPEPNPTPAAEAVAPKTKPTEPSPKTNGTGRFSLIAIPSEK